MSLLSTEFTQIVVNVNNTKKQYWLYYNFQIDEASDAEKRQRKGLLLLTYSLECSNNYLCALFYHKIRFDISCTFYAPAYSKNSGWALSITPVRPVHPSVRPTSCPGHNSQTIWNIFMKLHRCIHHIETMCHEQGRQLLHFWFLNYLPLT